MSYHDKLLSRKGRIKAASPSQSNQATLDDLKRAAAAGAVASEAADLLPGIRVEALGRIGSEQAQTYGDDTALPVGAPPFSVRSLAARWGCSDGAVRNLIRNGTLSHFRIGDLIRIPAEEVARFECRS